MAPVAGKSVEPTHYKLYGVLYHHGESAGSGYYTVDVLHPNGDGGSREAWLHINDEAVCAVRCAARGRFQGARERAGGRPVCLYAVLLSHNPRIDTMTPLR